MRRSRNSNRGAFTLVELLVVITIIGMLMAMMFPALGAFLAKVDQMRCGRAQGEIAKAIGLYVTSNTFYPGYSEPISMSTGEGGASRQKVLQSWIVAVMKELDEKQYDAIRKNLHSQSGELKNFNCPANAREGDLIGYVANCGRQDALGAGGSIPPDWKANGVFMQRPLQLASGVRVEKVRATDIADGEANTLAISENLQATRWTVYSEPDIGMVWHADGSNPDVPKEDSMRINRERGKEVTKGDYNFARPSSNHPGGVVVAYCDGHYDFLDERVDYGAVYCKLMSSNNLEVKEPGQDRPSHEFFRQPFDASKLDP